MLMDAELRGFAVTISESSLPNPVFATRGKMSDIELLSRDSHVSWFNPPRVTPKIQPRQVG